MDCGKRAAGPILVMGVFVTPSIGPQYKPDDPFKAAARLHQSRYRATVLKVEFSEYGNRLTEADGRALLNFYDGLGVRQALRKRYPKYSKTRDADLLRSEHIPFNMLAPLDDRPSLAIQVLGCAFGVALAPPFKVRLEWKPSPAHLYLNDRTSFDTYIQGYDELGRTVGVGIEVKYTEREYKIKRGTSEWTRVTDPQSTYWVTTRDSGVFIGGGNETLAVDELRQIWRNHLLGLAMHRLGDVERFVSVTLYPEGNDHFPGALSRYRDLLQSNEAANLRGCTYEHFIGCLHGSPEIAEWKDYLRDRYLVRQIRITTIGTAPDSAGNGP